MRGIPRAIKFAIKMIVDYRIKFNDILMFEFQFFLRRLKKASVAADHNKAKNIFFRTHQTQIRSFIIFSRPQKL